MVPRPNTHPAVLRVHCIPEKRQVRHRAVLIAHRPRQILGANQLADAELGARHINRCRRSCHVVRSVVRQPGQTRGPRHIKIGMEANQTALSMRQRRAARNGNGGGNVQRV